MIYAIKFKPFRKAALAICIFGFAGLAAVSPVRGDVIGPACVINGNTLSINGKRSHNRCVGGTTVRLFGIVSPEISQLCDAPGGRKWFCGRASAAILLEAVRGKILKCQGNSKDKNKQLLAICYLDGKNLNELLVLNGWALAYKRHSEIYLKAESHAVAKRKGLWQVTKNAKFEWRNR